MTQGIYIVGNDNYYDETVACINSIRFQDDNTPIIVIPYDDNLTQLRKYCREWDIGIFSDHNILKYISRLVRKYLPDVQHPRRLLNLACWFGPFERFLYMDADIVAFNKLDYMFKYLTDYDFVHADNQHHTGIKYVFSERMPCADKLAKKVFNGGFWASRQDALSLLSMHAMLRDCGQHPEYFHRGDGISSQPYLNYMAVKLHWKVCNLNKKGHPPSWAGNPAFVRRGHALYLGDQKLRYLHWAGKKVEEHYPEIWQFYRQLT